MTELRPRHLAAVMFTDLVGYTALMQADEAGALAARSSHRRVLQSVVPRHNGRLVQFLGDGSLSVFPSSVSAVAAALEIQRTLASECALPLRVGIDEGEVAYDEQGVYGHCVNRAARIEGVAEPGAVFVSEKVRGDIQNQPEFSALLVGEFELKNVDAPTRVYRVRPARQDTQVVELRLLGGVSLKRDGTPVSGRSAQRRRVAFLALLAAAPHGVMSRDKVVGYLWPDTDPQKARRLLSEALYVIRKSLGDDAIVATGGELRLNEATVWSDVTRYRSALETGDLASAVELYAGPFLDGFYVDDALDFDHWADGVRDRLAREYVEALETLALQAEADGRPTDAVRWWRDLVRVDPFDAAVAMRYMEALEAAGRRAEAIQVAQKHARLLREEFEAEPNPEVEALAARLRDSPASARIDRGAPAAVGDPDQAAAPPGDAHEDEVEAAPASSSGDTAPTGGASVPAAPNQVREETAAAGPAPGRGDASRGRLRPVVAGALVVMLSAWGLYRASSPEPAEAPLAVDDDIVRVAVFPFEGEPEDLPVWKLLATYLDGAGDVESVAPANLAGRLAWRETGPVGRTVADSLARVLSATHFTLGDVTGADDQVYVTVRIYRVGETEAFASIREVGQAGDPLDLFSRLAFKILPELSNLPPDVTRFAGQSTDSEEALRSAYGGDDLFVRARFHEAIAYYQEAVRLDPSYAYAHHRLSQSYQWDEQYVLALEASDRARELSPALSDHDRMLVVAWNHFLSGRAEEAVTWYRRVLDRWREDVEALYGLSKVALLYNNSLGRSRVGEAQEYLNRLLEVAPAFGDIHLAMLEFSAGARDREAFEAALARVDTASRQGRAWMLARDLVWNRQGRSIEAVLRGTDDQVVLGSAAAQVASFFGRYELADSVVETLSTRPSWDGSEWQAMAIMLSGTLDVAQGHFAQGDHELRRARPVASAWARELQALYAGSPIRPDRTEASAEAYREMAAWTHSESDESSNVFLLVHTGLHGHLRQYLLGLLAVWSGEAAAAAPHLDSLESQSPATTPGQAASQLAQSLRAHLAWDAGDGDRALQHLEQVDLYPTLPQLVTSPFFHRPHDRHLEATIRQSRGEHNDAARLFKSLTETWDYGYAAPAYLGLAQSQMALGRVAEARASYDRAAALLSDADPGTEAALADVREALESGSSPPRGAPGAGN